MSAKQSSGFLASVRSMIDTALGLMELPPGLPDVS
jgi:hypothetical protein